jgi:hypothetical protein
MEIRVILDMMKTIMIVFQIFLKLEKTNKILVTKIKINRMERSSKSMTGETKYSQTLSWLKIIVIKRSKITVQGKNLEGIKFKGEELEPRK